MTHQRQIKFRAIKTMTDNTIDNNELIMKKSKDIIDQVKKESKWIKFMDVTSFNRTKRGLIKSYPKTKTFLVINKESESTIGQIKWYGPFRQYSFFPDDNCVFEKTCLSDITQFIIDLNENRKIEREVEKRKLNETI